eukprot:m.231058 g.231058  ORF g.231058 m.231058 type:complete len:343 (+) comp17063_c2_seq4:104-1132(+)
MSADDEWQDVLGSGAILKKIIQAGSEEAGRPARGWLVNITASLTVNGDERYKDTKFSFRLGESEYQTAWDIILPLMNQGERSLVKTQRRFVSLEDITDDDEIIFDLCLDSFEETTPEELMSTQERLDLAELKRKQGKAKFDAGDYHSAASCYQRALAVLSSSADSLVIPEEDALKMACIPCWNNLALIHLKLNNPALARDKCDFVLAVEPQNRKALYRKAQALIYMGKFDEALIIAEQGCALDEQLFTPLRSKAQREVKVDKKHQQEVYKRMMADMNTSTKRVEDGNKTNTAASNQVPAWWEEIWENHLARGFIWAVIFAALGVAVYYLSQADEQDLDVDVQ